MIRFFLPQLLWLLLALLPLALLRGRWRPAPAIAFSANALTALTSGKQRLCPLQFAPVLRLLTLSLLILAAARPQFGTSTTEIEASGIDIMLAVDISGSMEAMDFQLAGKNVNRLTVVKQVVEEFIAARPNDRIGLIAFGGLPYLVCPLTLDHDWLRNRLQTLATEMAEDGTAIGSAIGSSVNRLREHEAKSQIIILLTDGVNNSGRVPPQVAAEAAATLGMKIYTIGAGTRGRAPVPVVDSLGRRHIRMFRVELDEDTLTEVASLTGGRYFRATDSRSLAKIYNEIDEMETTSREIQNFTSTFEFAPFLICLALFCLAGEIGLQNRQLP